MLRNFFLLDLWSSLWAFVLFGLFALVPGYAVGWTADLIGFRRWGGIRANARPLWE